MEPEDLFPYPQVREAQRELMRRVKAVVERGGHLMAQGPTGMGKTVAILCGALCSLGDRRLVYCCRTHKQMDRVIEELRAVRAEVSAIPMRGKREMCLNRLVHFTTSPSEAAHACAILKRERKCEFFENMSRKWARFSKLVEEFSGKVEFSSKIRERCSEEKICPYELARELLGQAEVVAANYLYILDPKIREGFLSALGEELENLVLVFDEAHNLPLIASELASDRETSTSIRQAIREARDLDEEVAETLEGWHESVKNLAEEYFGLASSERLISGREILSELPNPEGFAERVLELGETVLVRKIEEGKAPRSHLRHLGVFLLNWIESLELEEYAHFISQEVKNGERTVRLELLLLDPRGVMEKVLGCHATISVSGTLSPLEASRDILGLPQNTELLELPSPFLPENVLSLIVEGVTTKESYRLPHMYRKINRKLSEICEATPENVGIFTASYEVLQGLLQEGLEDLLDKPLFVESAEMSSSKNDELIREFKSYAGRGGAVLLGVMGGRNSEGGDFPGDQMNAVALVGIPYSPPDARTEAAIAYYEKQFPGKGKYYAYYLPAHRKLSQAAGRAHRLVEDRAAIVFLDRRVRQPFVLRSLPNWMKRRMEVVRDADGVLKRRLEEFFRRTPNSLQTFSR